MAGSETARVNLAGKGLVLRPFDASDTAQFVTAVNESLPLLARWMPWAHPAYTADEAQAWFATAQALRAAGTAHEYGIFRDDGRTFVGGVGLNQFNVAHNFCNLGYWVRHSAQRQGLATAAATVLARYGFSALGLSRIEIVAAHDNTASNRVAIATGARHECLARNRLVLHGIAIDANVYSLIRADLSD